MAKSKIVSLAMPPRILREVDRLARNDGRSRSSYVARALGRVIADSASSSGGFKSMTDNSPTAPTDGHVADQRLSKHGGVPAPATPTGNKTREGELLDKVLTGIPPVKREF